MKRNPGGAPLAALGTLRGMQSAPLNLHTSEDEEESETLPVIAKTEEGRAALGETEPQRHSPAERVDSLPAPPAARVTPKKAPAAAAPTSALALLNEPPPPRKSLANRVGTRGAPYTRRDGKKTLKLQAAISEETFELLDHHAKSLPRHVKYNDFVDMIVRDGIAKFERDLQESASANLQNRKR